MKLSLSTATIFALISGIEAFSVSGPSSTPEVSRRESFAKVASIVGGAGLVASSMPSAAVAYPSEETPKIVTRMGGLLVSFFLVK